MIGGIPEERARIRTTLTRQVRDWLVLGVEINPMADDVGILVNARVFEETERRPALIVGTSSDRIGTSSGRAVYGTLSKDLEPWIHVPVAPYAGLAWGDHDDEFNFIAGGTIRWHDQWTSTHVWDGHNLHHIIDYIPRPDRRVGLVVVEQDSDYYVGVRMGWGF